MLGSENLPSPELLECGCGGQVIFKEETPILQGLREYSSGDAVSPSLRAAQAFPDVAPMGLVLFMQGEEGGNRKAPLLLPHLPKHLPSGMFWQS